MASLRCHGNSNVNETCITTNVRLYLSGAIVGVGDRKRGDHAVPSKSQVCYFKNKLRHLQRQKLERELENLHGSRMEFHEMGDRPATLFEYSLNFASTQYLDIQCIHGGRIRPCCINTNRDTPGLAKKTTNSIKVKPLLSGHLRDLPKSPLNGGCPLNRRFKNYTILTINIQRLLCTVIKFHVVKEADEAVLYFQQDFRVVYRSNLQLFDC